MSTAPWPISNPYPIFLPAVPTPWPCCCPMVHLQPLSHSLPSCPMANLPPHSPSPTLILRRVMPTTPWPFSNPYPTALPSCPMAHLQPLSYVESCPMPHGPSPTLIPYSYPLSLPHGHATAPRPLSNPRPPRQPRLLDLAVEMLVQGGVEDGLTLGERPGPRRGAQGCLR